jgi:hypothetical protein
MMRPLVVPFGYQEKTRQVSSRRSTILTILVVLVATLVGSGCASYHRFRPTAVEYSGISEKGKDLGDMTDAAVVSEADRVRDILRKRFHIARITRQTSSSAQILLAGVAGIAAAFTAGATAIVGLAAGSVAMPQLAETFDAGGRAVAYQQAVAKISAAENAYFRARVGRSPVVPDNVLTVDGALLYEAINGATDAVELFQAGMLPTLEQMQRADAGELKRRAARRTGETGVEVETDVGVGTGLGSVPTPDVPPLTPAPTLSVHERRKALIGRIPNLSEARRKFLIETYQPGVPIPTDPRAQQTQLQVMVRKTTDPMTLSQMEMDFSN